MPTLLERLKMATNAFIGREKHAMEAPPPPAISMFADRIGLEHPFKPEKSIDMLGENPWLWAAINAVSTEASRIKLYLIHEEGDEVEVIKEHQVLDVLNNPLPMITKEGRGHMTGRELLHLTYDYLQLNGEGFWLMDGKNVGGNPTRIFTLIPQNVYEHLGKDNLVSHYIYRVGREERRYEAESVVHFKIPNPKEIFRGHSPIKSARWALDSHREADKMNFYRMVNNAIPGGVLSTEQAIPEGERKKLIEQWKAMYGRSRNKGKVAIMPWGLKFDPVQETNADMQFKELKDTARDEVLANYRVPIEITGKTEDQTRANAEASNLVFMRYTILPLLETVTDTLNNDFLPMFGGTDGLRFGFDDPVPDNLEEKRRNVETLFNTGAITPNEARKEFNLDSVEEEGADKTYIPFNMITLSNDGKEPEIEPKEDQSKRIRHQGEGGDLIDVAKEIAVFSALALPFIIDGFKKGVSLAHIPGSAITINDILTPHVLDALRKQSLMFATETLNTTKELLTGELKESIAAGEGPKEAAKRIDKLYDEKMGYRSVRIARTELTEAINDGQLRTLQAEGYEYKEWFTNLDGRERPSHSAAHGQKVRISEPFQVGFEFAMKPGDGNLSAAERCNCRCDIIGAGSSDEFKKNHFERFIRIHGSLETRFVTALNEEFGKQKKRVISNLSTP